MVLITYDVNTTTEAGEKRLRKIAKLCMNYGQRVQNSVFECLVEPHQMVLLKNMLIDIMDKEKDSLRFYYLGSNWRPKIEHIGANPGYDPEGILIT
jgi:CRISPR-associated protein Cas2